VLAITSRYFDYYPYLMMMKNNEIHYELNKKKNIDLFILNIEEFLPGFDPVNVLEKLPDNNPGILTPSSISSIRNNSIGIG
jgi:hypothetical protein